MSTKIYEAYRIEPADFWPMAEAIKVKARAKLTKKLRKVALDLCLTVDPESEEYLKHPKDVPDYLIRLAIVQDQLRNGYKESATSMRRSRFDFNVCVALHPHPTGIYAIPYCDECSYAGGTLNFLKRMKGLSDARYWNNTDRPSHISNKAWETRRAVWNEISKNWSNHVQLVISDYSLWWKVDPIPDMCREAHNKIRSGRPLPKFPSLLEQQVSFLEKLGVVADLEGTDLETPALVGPELRLERVDRVWKVTFKGEETEHLLLDEIRHWLLMRLDSEYKALSDRLVERYGQK